MERINLLEQEIEEIRKTLYVKQKELYELKKTWTPLVSVPGGDFQCHVNLNSVCGALPKWAIERYSRQILLSDIGVPGQQKLCEARVLVVGAGGLGCPAAVYLAAAGVGELGIVDYDTVELTNIHRQILHGEEDQNMSKVESAAYTLRSINSRITITPYNLQLDSSNAMEIVSKYDLVLDCTDNVPTRYMLNDVCVLNKVPLVSGSALKMEGQITIYGYRDDRNSKRGPCYRCVFPAPPPAAAAGSCSAHGVAGPVPGLIGAMQALEAIKYIVGQPWERLLVERMILFDGEDMTFRTVKLRPQNPDCAVCGNSPVITQLVDYETFCRAQAKEKDLDLHILPIQNRITPRELAAKMNLNSNIQRHLPTNSSDYLEQRHLCTDERNSTTLDLDKETRHLASGDATNSDLETNLQRHLLVDVRSEQEYLMCKIDGAVNYPIDNFSEKNVEDLIGEVKKGIEVTFVCRRGNDSQIAAQRLLDHLEGAQKHLVRDLTGGLHGWAKYIDNNFPVY